MKKLAALVLSLCFVLNSFLVSFAVSAGVVISAVASKTNVNPGEIITVDLKLSSVSNVSGGVSALNADLSYDTSVLEYRSIAYSPSFSASNFSSNNRLADKKITLMYIDDSLAQNQTIKADTTLFTITFAVKADVVNGKSNLTLSNVVVGDANANCVSATASNAFINVYRAATFGGIENNGVYKENKTINFTNATVTLNGTAITSPYEISAEGKYTLVLTNQLNEETIYNFEIDKTAPVITLGDYIKTITNEAITVTATANEGTLNVTSQTFTENSSFEFVATDAAGNITRQSVTVTNIVHYSKGDINLDGGVDVLDLLLIKRYLMKIISLSEISLFTADFYNKSAITIADMLAIKKMILLTDGNSQPVYTDKSISLTLRPSSTQVKTGDTVNVIGSFGSEVTIGAFDITIHYNTDQLQFVSVEGISPATNTNELSIADKGNGDIQILFLDDAGGTTGINGADAIKLTFVVIGKNECEVALVDAFVKTVADANADAVRTEKTPAMMTIGVLTIGGVENDGFYISAREITFNFGKATLNGNEITSGVVVSEAGDYTLEVKDAAGYVTFVRFTICLPQSVTLNNEKIYGIKAGATIAEIKSAFTLSANSDIVIKRIDGTFLGDNEYAGTGMKVCFTVNGVIKKEFTAMIIGDVSGDGMINVLDLLFIKRNILGITLLSDVYSEAANMDKDENNSITAIDFLKLKRMILGLENF